MKNHFILKFLTLILIIFWVSVSFSQQFDEIKKVKSFNYIQPKVFDIDKDGENEVITVSLYGDIVMWKKVNDQFEKKFISRTNRNYTHFDIADIDNDSDYDILVTDRKNQYVRIYYNDGNQNFSNNTSLSKGLPSNVLAGDFNNDGLTDFVVSSEASNGQLELFLKNTTGTGYNRINLKEASINRENLQITDIDGDGDVDIIASLHRGNLDGENKILCLINDGSANFTEKVIEYQYANKHIQVLDYDNDGDNDFVVTNTTSWGVTLFINDGNLNFQKIQLLSDSQIKSLYISDIDNDGDSDILASVFSVDKKAQAVKIYLNDGQNNFSISNLEFVADIEKINEIDINNDGLKDFISISSTHDDPRIYENTGNRNFKTIILEDLLIGHKFHSEDIDNDGLIDLISISKNEFELVVWHNQGNFEFSKKIIEKSESLVDHVDIKDINNDGHKDILLNTHGFNEGQILLYLNDGNMNFTKTIMFDEPNRSNVFAVDVENDGDLDIVYSIDSKNGKIRYYRNDGNGNYETVSVTESIDYTNCIGYIDLDNDGHKDFITDNTIYFKNDGNFNFTPVSLPQSGEYFDIDGDGDLDILSVRYEFQSRLFYLSWFENDGEGNFKENQIKTFSENIGYVFTIQDFDGDKDIDFLSSSFNEQEIYFWENDGNQNFTAKIITINDNGENLSQLLSKDFDGDGDIDFLSSDLINAFTLWKNTSNIPLSNKKIDFNKEIKTFPNPSSDYITIEGIEDIFRVNVYNILGKRIHVDFDKQKRIDIRNLNKGLYFLEVKSYTRNQTVKFIKL